MKNQSSLNDVFRFIQLRQPNKVALKERTQLYGSITIPTLTQKDRIELANAFFQDSKSKDIVRNIEYLAYGTHIFSSLQNALQQSCPTVAILYDLIDDITIVQTMEFKQDIERLSNTILLSRFATKNVPDNLQFLEKLYIVYITLEQASNNEAYLALPLDRALNAVISHTWSDLEKEQNKIASRLQSVGVADLLVVKQHILRYEATEIAHIENIMAGETRSREHRYLDRFEETLTFEIETTTEQEKEFQTTERFEMNRETSRTIKEDQKYGAELSISASYGPTVEFNANFEMEISRSEESSSKNASTYAKDVMERSLERVKEQVREERIRKIIRETEEKNIHSFQNTNIPSEHISGIYQFVDKIYKAQVFNYGKRQMFDLMIPEPASYLWYLEEQPPVNSRASIEAPKKFDINPFDITYMENIVDDGIIIRPTNHYTELAKLYGATGVQPPPFNKTVTFQHQQPGSSVSGSPDVSLVDEGSGFPRGHYLAPIRVRDIEIPQGYVPKNAEVHALVNSDSGDEIRVDFVLGPWKDHLLGNEMVKPVELPYSTLPIKDLRYGRKTINFDNTLLTNWNVMDTNSKMPLSIFVYNSGNHTISGKVECKPSENLIQKWQLETYDTIRSAYQDRLLEYQDEQARIKAEQKAQEEQQNRVAGVPPAKRKQVLLNELKKHAVTIFTNNYMHNSEWESNNPMENGASNPPIFNVGRAINQGNFIRFFEQAFEWDQIQYAFYPYFWHTDKEKWRERFLKDDSDYEYQQFLQAGAARVVLPVRPGFEEAIAHYVETGKIWNGAGTPPRIGDPLYVSIIQELRESTGGRTDEPIAVGKPWEVRLPTNLILLKPSSNLPEWRETEEGNWEWIALTANSD